MDRTMDRTQNSMLLVRLGPTFLQVPRSPVGHLTSDLRTDILTANIAIHMLLWKHKLAPTSTTTGRHNTTVCAEADKSG